MQRLSAALADRYRIERELGAGGMATVYLAYDVRHDRKVALKVLRPELAAILGGDRFLAEIRTTANLQHPHILSLFDSGEADGLVFYVMPYVDGESLRDRLRREHQLPVDDAVRITREVADALEYAHGQGIVHRDIKPENVLLHGGHALVADFGIALAAARSEGGTRLTETGMSLGTPQYMSPEQAMGEREITARSDVYALGVVLYEMLTGDPPFTGSTAQAIVARVLTETPRALIPQRHTVPAHVEEAVLTALEKLPADRFASAAAFATALVSPGGVVRTLRSATAARPWTAAGWRARLRDPVVLGLALVAAGAVAIVVAMRSARRPAAAALPPIRFVLGATDSTKPVNRFPWPAAISRDGGMVAYSAATAAGTMLYALRTDQLEARPIPGTADAYQPYFSPDGQWLAFEAGGQERKVRLDGSAPVTICDANGANGADWLVGDEIVLGAQGRFHGLSRVSAAGGEVVALTQPDTARGERDHLWPIGLLDGRTVVFTVWTGSLATSRLAITSLADGRVVPLGIAGIRPLAVLDGMLVYVQADGTVMAVALDARGRRLRGRPIPVHDPVPVSAANNGNSGIFISRGGALVTSGGGTRGRLSWISRAGRVEPVLPHIRAFNQPKLSPDGRRIAVIAEDGGKHDVWVYDRTLTTFSRLTSSGTVTSLEWSADGSHVLFAAAGEGVRGAVWSQSAAGGSPPDKLFEVPFLVAEATLSPDGKSLLLASLSFLESSWDVVRVPLDSARLVRIYQATRANEASPRFSPDGRWVAIQSDELGVPEVYVRSFPDPSAKIQVSVSGGTEPLWSRDGSRLYYRSGSALVSARITFSPGFTLLGRDTVLSNAPFSINNVFFGANYDVSRDGQRILGVVADENTFRLVVSPNWLTELRRRITESGGGK